VVFQETYGRIRESIRGAEKEEISNWISSDILRMLQQFGFTSRWCEWIRACVSTISYSILSTCPPPKVTFRGLERLDKGILFLHTDES
jgi:hypothetical protein